jgi:hypothetical protein
VPSPGGSGSRPQGQQPLTPGETFPTRQATPSPSLAATRSLPTGLHRLSAATPSPLTFDPTEQARLSVAFGASKYSRSDAPPKSNVASHEVSCLLTDLVTKKPQRSWL